MGSSISAQPPLPELAVLDSTAANPLLPEAAEGSVRSWTLNPRTICYGYEAAGLSWIHVGGMATFRFSATGSRVDAFLAQGRSFVEARDTYERSVLPLIVQAMGVQVLHASAVLNSAGLIALAGISTSGKSTISYALAQRGSPLWADDAVAFFLDGDLVRSLPLPFAPRLRPAAATQLGALRPADVPGGTETVPIGAIVLLRPETAFVGVGLEPLRPADAFPALLPHAYCFSMEDIEGNRVMIDEYLRLVERVPVWCIRFRTGLENLPRIVDKLEGLLA